MSEPMPASIVRSVIRASSMAIGVWHPAAEELLMMVAAHESHMGKYLRQVGGPALGIFQMEPATYQDCLSIVVPRRPYWRTQLVQLAGGKDLAPELLVREHAFAAAMARLQLWRHKEALPDAGDVQGLARYAKTYWNGPGKASTGMYVQAYRERAA